MSDATRVIEINGLQIEVDGSTDVAEGPFKIGDPVKVLHKGLANTEPKIMPGVIIGYGGFLTLPSIEVMVLGEEYTWSAFRFIVINEQVRDFEIVRCNRYEQVFGCSKIVERLDRDIARRELELLDLKNKKFFFAKNFQKAFAEILEE